MPLVHTTDKAITSEKESFLVAFPDNLPRKNVRGEAHSFVKNGVNEITLGPYQIILILHLVCQLLVLDIFDKSLCGVRSKTRKGCNSSVEPLGNGDLLPQPYTIIMHQG